jgi:hypothetical protein
MSSSSGVTGGYLMANSLGQGTLGEPPAGWDPTTEEILERYRNPNREPPEDEDTPMDMKSHLLRMCQSCMKDADYINSVLDMSEDSEMESGAREAMKDLLDETIDRRERLGQRWSQMYPDDDLDEAMAGVVEKDDMLFETGEDNLIDRGRDRVVPPEAAKRLARKIQQAEFEQGVARKELSDLARVLRLRCGAPIPFR